MALSPIGHSTPGRTQFLIHGDRTGHPGSAFEGGIALDWTIRHTIANSSDRDLDVIR